MKRFALKGLLAVTVVALLCLFLSGTLHTILTAKVSFTTARTGKLESSLTLTGQLYWADSLWLYTSDLQDQDSLSVKTVSVQKGSWVKAGDVLMTCEVTDYDRRMETYRAEYETQSREILELDRKYGYSNPSPRQQHWLDAYESLLSASESVRAAREELQMAALEAGIALDGDQLPADTADEHLLALAADLDQALRAEAEARTVFERINRYAPDEEFITYVHQKASLQLQLDQIADNMVVLRWLRDRYASVRAPHDGYILSCDLKAGDQLSGHAAYLQMTVQGAAPVIRLDAGGSRTVVENGSAVTISAGGAQTVSAAVSAQGLSEEGTYCLDVQLTHRDLMTLGGFLLLSEANSASATITIRAEQSSTLIPTAALRGSDPDYYVYVAESTTDAFGAEKWIVFRKNVTLLGQSGGITSVRESLQNVRIVYMEDRVIQEGCEVMQYENQ